MYSENLIHLKHYIIILAIDLYTRAYWKMAKPFFPLCLLLISNVILKGIYSNLQVKWSNGQANCAKLRMCRLSIKIENIPITFCQQYPLDQLANSQTRSYCKSWFFQKNWHQDLKHCQNRTNMIGEKQKDNILMCGMQKRKIFQCYGTL